MEIAESKRSGQRAKLYAQILLLSDESLPRDKGASRSDTEIVEQLECHPLTIRKTRKRARQRGVLDSLTRKVNEPKVPAPEPSVPKIQVLETTAGLSWEEEAREQFASFARLEYGTDWKEELQKIDTSSELRLKAASTILEKATGYGLLQNSHRVDDLVLISTKTRDGSGTDVLDQMVLLCQTVQPLIRSLLTMLPRTEDEDEVASGKSLNSTLLKKQFRQKLEKAKKRVESARTKMGERTTSQSHEQIWSNAFRDYFEVVVESYKDIVQAIQELAQQKESYVKGLIGAAKPLVTDLLLTRSARDKAEEEAEHRATEIDRMRRSSFITPPYNVACFADALNLSRRTIKDLIAAYIEIHKDSDFPSRFRNNPTRKTDQGGYITDFRSYAVRFFDFFVESHSWQEANSEIQSGERISIDSCISPIFRQGHAPHRGNW